MGPHARAHMLTEHPLRASLLFLLAASLLTALYVFIVVVFPPIIH